MKALLKSRLSFSVAVLAVAHFPLFLNFWVLKNMGFNLRGWTQIFSYSNWLDVGWYLGIAERGYWLNPSIKSQSTAFFPLYPWLIKTLSSFSGWQLEVSAFWLQRVLFVFAALALGEYWVRSRLTLAELESNQLVDHRFQALGFVFFFFMQPALVFYAVPYTEALFVTLTVPIFLSLDKPRVTFEPLKVSAGWGQLGPILLLAVLGFLAALTRPTGLLFAPLALAGFLFFLKNPDRAKAHFALGLGLGVGLCVLMWTQWTQVGDPLSFWNVRGPGWDEKPGIRNLTAFLIPQIGGKETFRYLFVYLSLCGVYLCYKSGRKWTSVICLFLILMPLYQGKIIDIVRYAGSCFPIWAATYERAKERPLVLMILAFFFTCGSIYFSYNWVTKAWVG